MAATTPTPTTLQVYGATWCSDCRRTKAYLDELAVPYDWIDLEQQPDAADLVVKLNGGLRIIPTLVFADGSCVAEPSNQALHQKLLALGLIDQPAA